MTIIVIGAGIAGITAARELQNAEQDVTILEARDRIGGRIFTDRTLSDGIPVELGAEFIHGEKAPQWQYVNELGLRTLHWTKLDDSLVRTEDKRLISMREARQDPEFDIIRSWNLPHIPIAHNDDEDLYHYLNRIGFNRSQLQYVRRMFANAMGEDIHHISAREVLDIIRDKSVGDEDHRILDGYDTIVEHLAQGLTIHVNNPVRLIKWAGQEVIMETADGTTYHAEQVIVAVPLGVLHKSREMTFEPRLPDDKLTAIRGTEMGPGMKIVYVFEEPVLPKGITALYSAENPPMWWSPSFGQVDATSFVITAFATGKWANELQFLGDDGIASRGLRTLANQLERDIPEPLTVHIQNWTNDPFTNGVYSVAKAGGSHFRSVLAQPLDGKLFFAGEATASNAWAATVHGAYSTGKRAAQEVLERRS